MLNAEFKLTSSSPVFRPLKRRHQDKSVSISFFNSANTYSVISANHFDILEGARTPMSFSIFDMSDQLQPSSIICVTVRYRLFLKGFFAEARNSLASFVCFFVNIINPQYYECCRNGKEDMRNCIKSFSIKYTL